MTPLLINRQKYAHSFLCFGWQQWPQQLTAYGQLGIIHRQLVYGTTHFAFMETAYNFWVVFAQQIVENIKYGVDFAEGVPSEAVGDSRQLVGARVA